MSLRSASELAAIQASLSEERTVGALSKITKSLEEHVKRSNTRSTNIGGYYNTEVLSKLRALGYTVIVHTDQRDGDYLEISW